ncbi:MAG: phosphoadenosine phosphosulfate reductase family protein [Deltaproteobacteria bacterium]|nr:phosphoadenosine phosphosulfate reductase family protein [Deltaproteobacteria bacterium]
MKASTGSSTATSSRLTSLPTRLNKIAETLRREYCRKHNYPWIVAYSGGKDSTLLLQMVWETVAALPAVRRRRSILIVGNDTLVESPLVIHHLRDSLKAIGAAASEQGMPVDIRVTTPAIDQTFWVSVIGRGYIPPTRNFRWCTDRMKIRPTSRLLKDIVGEHGGAFLLIGTRRSESQNRQRGMDRRKVSAGKANDHDSVEGCRIFSPLADLDDDDVWMVLMQRRPIRFQHGAQDALAPPSL